MLQILVVLTMYVSTPLLVKNIRAINKNSLLLLYILETIFLLDLWTIVVLPFLFLDKTFGMAVHTYILICVLIYIGLLIYSYKNKETFRKSIHLKFGFIKDYKWQAILLFIIIGYQVFRCAFFQTVAYSDSKTYIAIINDMLETNRFFLLNEETGNIIGDITTVSQKYSLAMWYSFEAVISYVLGLHPLIVVNTILPPIILVFSYCSLWFLSSILLKDHVSKRISFLIAIALFYQFQTDDPSLFFMIWPTWGKNIVMSIMVPMMVYIYYTKTLERGLARWLTLIFSFGACFSSTMGVVIVPLLYVIISLVEIINRRKINIQDMITVTYAFVPVGVYVCLYMIW